MASIAAPAGLAKGLQYRVVFVTDGQTNALHADHGYYDQIIQAEAAKAGLDNNLGVPVTWLAMISSMDGTKLADRLPIDNVPLYTLSAVNVATGSSPILENLLNPINQSPTASGITGQVWTGGMGYPLGYQYHVQDGAIMIVERTQYCQMSYEMMRLFAFSQVFTVG
jgi:hypothetical protein